MIKAEVVFDWDTICVNAYKIEINVDELLYDVYLNDVMIKSLDCLEKAIKYCLEN